MHTRDAIYSTDRQPSEIISDLNSKLLRIRRLFIGGDVDSPVHRCIHDIVSYIHFAASLGSNIQKVQATSDQ